MPTSIATGFTPRTQTTGEGLKLAMQSLLLTGKVLPIGARLWVRHEFESQESRPVEVVYGFVLPRDATLRRFRISGDGFSVASELRKTEEARTIYEQGIQAGSLSTLAQQYGDGMVNLTVGNIRPGEKVTVLLELVAGVELHDDGLRMRFPFTLAPSYHSQARVIEAEPGIGEIELPGEEFGDLILPRFQEDAKHLHHIGFALDVEVGAEIREIASPSHALKVENIGTGSGRVSLARESDLPDRDLVIDVRKKTSSVSLFSGADREGQGRFAALIPSTEFGPKSTNPRSLVILLDRSGSMSGAPIDQAKKAIEACLAALDEHDLFGLIAFDDAVETFSEKLAANTTETRNIARQFLGKIDARGGTELATGIEAAAKMLGHDGVADSRQAKLESGDILIFTDGQVFATEAILERVRSTGARVHCLGIGSASQDRFLAHLATHTGGVSRFLTPSERVDIAALDLFAAIGRPVATDLRASLEGVDGARIAPAIPSQVFSGTPLLVFGDAPRSGDALLRIYWNGAQPEQQIGIPVPMAQNPLADTLKLLQGARLLSDCESRYVPRGADGAAEKREASRYRELLLKLSTDYGLPSSEMSLVSVVKRAGDVSGDIPKTQIVPVGLPQDMEFAGIFGGPAAAPAQMLAGSNLRSRGVAKPAPLAAAPPPMGEMAKAATGMFSDLLNVVTGKKKKDNGAAAYRPQKESADFKEPVREPEDLLVTLAGMLEPDGGMPGKTEEMRIANSLAALLFFTSQGSSRDSGPFRMHVDKLMRFLEGQPLRQLDQVDAGFLTSFLQTIGTGNTPKGDWIAYARTLVDQHEIDSKSLWSRLSATKSVV